MIRFSEKVFNGQVFKIEEEYETIGEQEVPKYRTEEYVCEEYSLIILAIKEQSDASIIISGTIFKQHYKGTPHEIQSTAILKVNEQIVGTLVPMDGVVEFSIIIDNASTGTLFKLRAECDTITGTLNI